MVYLIEEALELWSTIMSQTPAPASSEILSLLPMLCPIFQAATDCVPLALQIVESYILLAPQEVLSDQIRFHLLASLETLLKSTTRVRLGVVPHVVEMIIRCGDAVDGGSENTYNIIARSLVESLFLSSLLEGLYSAYEVSESTGPNRKKSNVYGVVETDYFSVLARLALANPRIFASAVSAATGTSEEQTLSWVLKEWFNHYDNIGSSNQKKLHTLGLTQILFVNGPGSQPPNYILNHLQSYLTIWTDIIIDLGEIGEEGPNESSRGDYLVYWEKATESSDWQGTPETVRRRNWEHSDVIHTVNIRDFLRQHLHSLIVGCGGEQRFQEEWLVNVDRDVVSSFGALGLL